MKLNHAEKGQSLVELALTLLIILTLLAGAVDLGMAFFSYVALRDAAQEGALYGSINPTDTDGIRDRVKWSSNTPIDFSAFSDEDIPVQIVGSDCEGLTDGEPNGVKVTVTYDYTLNGVNFNFYFWLNSGISGFEVSNRCEACND